MLNVTSAFTRACSGSMTEGSAAAFNGYMNNFFSKYDNLTGWLADTFESVKEAHSDFMSSRMWEFSNRINGKDGQFVGRFEIGYLSEVQYQQQAQGFMRDYIMANPTMMELYQNEQVSGWDGDFSSLCTGVGTDNYFYNKAMDGKVHFQDSEKEEDRTLTRTDYYSSRDELSHLSFSERVDIHRTWQATNMHVLKGLFDPTSITNEKIYSLEEVAKRKEDEVNNAGNVEDNFEA